MHRGNTCEHKTIDDQTKQERTEHNYFSRFVCSLRNGTKAPLRPPLSARLLEYRHRRFINRITDHIICHRARHPIFGLQDDTMAKDRGGIALDIVWRDEIAPIDRSV